MIHSIKHLQYLVALAKEQSFSKAAVACNVTQSTLSLGIQELERQMDIQLFERGRKAILPTAAGTLALAHAKTILKNSESLNADMLAFATPGAGPLRLGVIPTVAPYYLPYALPRFEEAFPNSHLQISEDTTDTVVRKITDGDMDIGLLALPVDIGDLDSKIIMAENFYIAYPKALDMPAHPTLDDLKIDNILLLRDGHCLKDHVLSACKLPPEKQNKFFEAESLQTLLAMVNQGYGLTLLPDMAVKADIIKPYPNVQIRPFASPAPTRQIGLVWRKTDIRANAFRGMAI